LALVVAVLVAVDRWRKNRPEPPGRDALFDRLTAAALVTLALPMLPLLSVYGLESERPWLILGVIVATALLCARSAHAWATVMAQSNRVQAASSWLERRRVPALLLLVAIVVQASWLIHLGLLRHQALGSRIFDLGIFDNIMHNALHGRFPTCTFQKGDTFSSAHASPLLLLLTPVYAIAPRAETLIVVQALWLCSAAIAVYRIAHHRLQRPWLALMLGVAYLLHPSLHGVVLFDFHALTLLAPSVLWAVDALERGHTRRYLVWLIVVVLTREDTPFVGICLGLYAAWGRGRLRLGLAAIGASIIALVAMKVGMMEHPALFMPDSETTYRYGNRFAKVIPDPDHGGAIDIVATVLSNPSFVLQHAIHPEKLMHLGILLTPVLAIPLFQRPLWPLFLYGLAFCLLASGRNLYYPYLHHTVTLFPAFYAATAEGIAACSRIGGRLGADRRATEAALAVAVVVSAGLCASEFGATGHSTKFRAGYVELMRQLDPADAQRYAWVRDTAQRIPVEVDVAASASLGPHVSNRDHVRTFRHHPDSPYLFVRWSELDERQARDLRSQKRRGTYEVVDRYEDELELLRRSDAPPPR
jgi:uncharacterized membrane protein